MISSIELTNPYWLWLLPILGAVLLLAKRIGHYDEYTGISSATPYSSLRFVHPLLALLPQNIILHRTSWRRSIGYSLVFACLALSLAQPVRIGKQLPDPPRERDIVFIVDSSVSMSLRDYVLDDKRIDRMSLLKGLLDRFIDELQGERVSIIVFGDTAYTLLPLTRDQFLARRMLMRLKTTLAGRYSAVGDGIMLAVKQARQDKQRRRVLVLLTDADQPSGNVTPATAARLAAQNDLPLYSIAIGAGSFAAQEQLTSGLIYHPADLELLKNLAAITGAHSYQAGDAKTLQQAIADISLREKNTAKITPRYYRQPLYLWPLLAAMLLLTLLQLARLLSTNRAGG